VNQRAGKLGGFKGETLFVGLAEEVTEVSSKHGKRETPKEGVGSGDDKKKR